MGWKRDPQTADCTMTTAFEATALPSQSTSALGTTITSRSSRSSPNPLEAQCENMRATDESSEWIENNVHSHHALSVCEAERPPILRYVPRIFLFENAPPEATGLALDVYARGAVVMSSLFIGPALLQLATDATEAECDQENCDTRIYGMKPSSLLSNIAIASGLIGSFIMPLFGAIVDHTSYRRQVGAISAVCLVLVKGLEVMISPTTWLFVAILQVFSGVLFNVHICATYAYTSELSTIPAEQTKFNTYYNVILYFSTLVFLVEVLVVAFSLGLGDVGTARVSQIITTATACVFFGLSWSSLFRDRPALSRVPEGQTLLMCGFRKIFQTTAMIRSELPALKWCMLAIMFNESATSALITVATTYMSHFLEMDATEIGVVFLVVLLLGIPGTKLGEKVALRFNPVFSAQICVVVFIFATTVAAFVLTGPDDKQFTVIFGVFWGVCLGWLHPMDSTIFITIIPKGQESELMGIYIFCGQVLSWLPPLLFTALNEAGVEMSIGLASLDVFFFLGLCCLWLMGSYDKALEHARLRSRDGYAISASNNGVDIEDRTGDIALPTLT